MKPLHVFSHRSRRIGYCLSGFLIFLLLGCSNLTGWRIPGTEKGAGATATVYLVLENVETIPEDVRSQGEIYVDSAFFGHTSRPAYYPFVGNELVVGTIQIQKEKTHTVAVKFPDYKPFEVTRYFGKLPEYSVTFSLQRDSDAGPVPHDSASTTEGTKNK